MLDGHKEHMHKTSIVFMLTLSTLVGCSSHIERQPNADCLFHFTVNSTSIDELAKQDSVSQAQYPNPFSPPTRIIINVPQQDSFKCGLYNINGIQVNKPFRILLEKGTYLVSPVRDSCPAGVSGSGVYFLRYQLGDSVMKKKIILLY